MVKYKESKLDLVFGALAHPIRRDILARLSSGEATVATLAKPHHVSAPAITKHLHILEGAGLLSREKKGRQVHCRLVPDRMQEAEKWIAHYRAFWENRLDRLEAYLEQQMKKEKPRGR